MSILQTTAISRQSGDNASQIMAAYVSTGPQIALDHTAAPALSRTKQPKGAAAGDQFTQV